MSETPSDTPKVPLELKPVKREGMVTFGRVIMVVLAVILLSVMVVPLLLGPALGNVYSNIVSNL